MLLKNEKSLRRLIESIVNSHYSKNIKLIKEAEDEKDSDSGDEEKEVNTDFTPNLDIDNNSTTTTSTNDLSQDFKQPAQQQPQQPMQLTLPGGVTQPTTDNTSLPSSEDTTPPSPPNTVKGYKLMCIVADTKDKDYDIAGISIKRYGSQDENEKVKLNIKKGTIFIDYGHDDDDIELGEEAAAIAKAKSYISENGVRFIVNIGYIPCYSLEQFKINDNYKNIFTQFKKDYLTFDQERKDAVDNVFAYIFACRHLNHAIIDADPEINPNDYLTQSLYTGKSLGDGSIINNNIKQNIINAANRFINDTFVGEDQKDINSLLQSLVTYQSKAHITFNECVMPQEESPPTEEKQDIPQQETATIHAWYRFPQLNGGFFEMADSLLSAEKMKKIQDTSRQYKPYEKKGELYGLIENADGNVTPAAAQHQLLLDFFKKQDWNAYVTNLGISDANIEQKIGNKINGLNRTSLGQILDEFFKNRKVLVGEYYLIDNAFLYYCILFLLEKVGVKVQQDYADAYANYVTKREPKIVKAKFKPDELPDDVTNADANFISPQKQTIKQMFNSRARNDLKKYNEKGDQSPEALQAFQKSRDLNLRRRNRERVYK